MGTFEIYQGFFSFQLNWNDTSIQLNNSSFCVEFLLDGLHNQISILTYIKGSVNIILLPNSV